MTRGAPHTSKTLLQRMRHHAHVVPMKQRLVVRLVLLTIVLGVWYFLRPDADEPRPMPPEIPIEDGKTIDFSQGKAEIRNTTEDQAAMDAALKEMEEAAKDVTFGASAKQP